MEHATFDVVPLREAYSILNILERMLRELGQKEGIPILVHLASPLVVEVKGLIAGAKVQPG